MRKSSKAQTRVTTEFCIFEPLVQLWVLHIADGSDAPEQRLFQKLAELEYPVSTSQLHAALNALVRSGVLDRHPSGEISYQMSGSGRKALLHGKNELKRLANSFSGKS